ncbi:MAG: SPOR domain-containing protein, partial [Rubrivivax sp.]|nr:SPOR domain-containing protein [Rubrivivax sp.]
APPASAGVAATTPPTPTPRAALAAVVPPPAARATVPDDGARARALLEGSGAPAKADGASALSGAAAPSAFAGAPDKAEARFVVQVGAYSDAATLREARQRVEQLGLKTYTQVVDTEAGKRTRVRIGPYASRDEADAAAAKVKRAGLPANILAL